MGYLFYHKKSKHDKPHAEVAIYIRITVNGQIVELSTKRKCLPSIWNASAGRLDGKTEKAKELNSYLDIIESKVYEAKKKLIEKSETITAEKIKLVMQGKEPGREKHMLMDAFRLHNEQMQKLKGIDYSESTVERYETSLEHTLNFMKFKYGIDDIDITELDFEFIAEYEFWLKTERKCNHNSTMKYLRNFKKIVNICVAKRWLPSDPFKEFKMSIKPVNIVALTEFELQAIASKSFNSDRLTLVRDIFLFSCFTGLAYADTKKLNIQDIFIGVDGQKWIECKRQKSNSSSRIPLLPIAEAIILKFQQQSGNLANGPLLPIRTNQKMNEYLKRNSGGL